MKLILHGGKCCGIKTIYEMGFQPSEIVPALRKKKPLPHEGHGFINGGGKRFFHEAAPKETKGERLDRYIKFVKDNRPKNIIEIVLAGYQKATWEGFLTERGFKIVNEHKNSNSGNRIYVFHLNVGE